NNSFDQSGRDRSDNMGSRPRSNTSQPGNSHNYYNNTTSNNSNSNSSSGDDCCCYLLFLLELI
ncbi:MAG TPA: hypothetical protein PKG70_12140, partial [Chitinophagales bacterium]|nr:hypothetical protein [Chitinophagales bacterium]